MEIKTSAATDSPTRIAPWKGIVAFLVLCLVGQYALVGAVAYGFMPKKLYAARIFGPLVAAMIVAYWTYGRAGWGKLFSSLFKWRCHWGWYVFALVWLTIFTLSMLVLENLVMGRGFAPIPFDFTNTNPFSANPEQAAASVSILRGSLLTAIIEEIAWVSLCMMLLTRYFTHLVASLITAVFWCSWWIPVILYGDGVIPGLPIPVLFIHYFGLAATCMWVYYFTGSALLVILMQFITNMVSLIVPVLPDSGGLGTYIVYVVSKCVLVLILFMKWGPKPLWKRNGAVTFPS